MFTDQRIAQAILNILITSDVMTADDQAFLRENATEVDVRERLNAEQIGNFGAYWSTLGVWMRVNGGDQAATMAAQVPGRQVNGLAAPAPVGSINRSMYEDCFRSVNRNIGSKNFSLVKAISNQIRFANNFLPPEEDEDN